MFIFDKMHLSVKNKETASCYAIQPLSLLSRKIF